MSAKTFTVGLPVEVTVHADGTVTYAVDLTDADCLISEDGDACEDATAAELDFAATAVTNDVLANGGHRIV